jgi:16S rRNA (uracil1498-N3)-methyltransferase
MRRFYIEEIREEDGFCVISGSEARHISKILRMGRGDRLVLFDAKGIRFQAVIRSVGPQNVRVVIEKSLPKSPPAVVEITLCQSLLRSQPMDYIVQKTSELGIHCIVPFISEKTVVRPDNKALINRTRHWYKIAQSAAKQSDRGAPIEIEPLISFHKMIDYWKGENGFKVILWEAEDARGLKSLIQKYPREKKMIGIIGPEGGFSIKEIAVAEKAGFIPVSLGLRILRAETAAITLAAIFQYEWGDLGLPIA